MQQPTDDMCNSYADDASVGSDSDTDESYNPLCSSYNESCSGSSSDEDSNGTSSDAVFTANDVEDEHWNGLWYATSDDYDCDTSDEDGASVISGTDGDSSSKTDESEGDGLDDMLTRATPSNMLSRDSRPHSLYGRACISRSQLSSRQQRFENAVHAAS